MNATKSQENQLGLIVGCDSEKLETEVISTYVIVRPRLRESFYQEEMV